MLPSTHPQIDTALKTLAANKARWGLLSLAEKRAFLDQVLRDVKAVEEDWVRLTAKAKGNQPGTQAGGEDWFEVGGVYRFIQHLRRALVDIERYGKPQFPGPVKTRLKNRQVVVQILPSEWKDALIYNQMRAEIWLDPSVTSPKAIPQAAYYRQHAPPGAVCLVLGAGNVGVLSFNDLLHKLYVEGEVVALKMNPVNDYLGPVVERGLASLVEAGFVRILYGGAAEGSYLAHHPLVETLHMTGSEKTFEAIVFGPGAEGQAHKQAHTPLLNKPFTSELGNISPVIVVPGRWTVREITRQGSKIGSWLVANAGCACLAPRMIIQHESWENRAALVEEISQFLAGIEARRAFYPGARDTHQQFLAAHPDARLLGEPRSDRPQSQPGSPRPDHLPWTFIPYLDPDNPDEICFHTEPFLGLFSETALAAGSIREYIQKAVEFANDRLWGTLSASIIVHPRDLRDPEIAAAVDDAIADLRYGTVVVNYFAAHPYLLMNLPWGASPIGRDNPGSDIYNIQSGTGWINNPLMFDTPQKSVFYAPFAGLIEVLAGAQNAYPFYRAYAEYQHHPTAVNLLRVLWRAVRMKG